MAEHNLLGKTGEDLAADFLAARGYCIRHRNWRAGRHELDIVAERDGLLVVVEVKARRNDAYGRPDEAVDERKVRSIVRATDAYLQAFGMDVPVRFDVIAVVGSGRGCRIDHIEDAFYPPLG